MDAYKNNPHTLRDVSDRKLYEALHMLALVHMVISSLVYKLYLFLFLNYLTINDYQINTL